MVQADALRDLLISPFSYPLVQYLFSVSQRVGSSIPGHAPHDLPEMRFMKKISLAKIGINYYLSLDSLDTANSPKKCRQCQMCLF